MTFKRITVSVPDEIAAKAQRAVESGEVESVSAYFSRLAAREPDWAAAGEVVDELITELGEVPDDAREWARAALGLPGDADRTGAS